MSSTPTTAPEGYGSSAYNLLKQQLITVGARLDRQVSQLTRLNRLSNRLLADSGDQPLADMFAEAIVDVLDLVVGAVWVLPAPTHGADQPTVAVFGSEVTLAEWLPLGEQLRQRFLERGLTRSVRYDSLGLPPLPGADLLDEMVCPCVGRSGEIIAVVLSANTPMVAGMVDAVRDDAAEMLMVLAEKCAVSLDDRNDHLLIQRQLRQLRESEERLELVLRGTNDGWWDWDMRSGHCFYSARWLQMMGAIGQTTGRRTTFWTDQVHADDRPAFQTLLAKAMGGTTDSVETELRLHREDDEYLPVLVRGTVSRDAAGRPTHFAGSILDLTERKVHEAHIHRLAFYDPLTDLPNRRLLIDRLQHSLRARTRTGQSTAVLMLDLDRFKTLNDTHGHAAGDELLRAVARRLVEVVRPYDTVARLSGDEFVVLLENLGTDPADATAVAEHVAAKVLDALNDSYTLDVGVLHYSASIGVAMATEPELTVDTLMKHADVALYQAKEAGRNAVRVFQPAMQLRVVTRSALEAKLREGIARREMQMRYQAQVGEHGELVAAEALMRWNPAGQKPVPPSEFIPVAEESGIIHPLGQWCLESVCAQVQQWEGHVPEGFRVAVNLSAPEFLHPNFTDRVVQTLRRTGVSGSLLRLEITEATVVTELGFAAERMNELRAYDLEFSLDDFGTGYSSLTYLRRLPVSEVKIDRSYVRRLLHDPHDAAIVKAILALCESLDLRVVAEGVETEAQWHRLLEDGCRYFQGFLFGRPQLPPPDPSRLTEWITTMSLDGRPA
jgi:diguanylate cyclase (GGDEF)-like protein/PAS domain S-box-containing protein